MSALRSNPLVASQEIYANNVTSLTDANDLGACMTTGDGRVYRYVSVGTTALVAGKMYQAPAQDTTNFQALGVSVAAGTLTTTVTTGSSVTLTANQLAGGLLSVRSGSGVGFSYQIKSHPAVTAGTVTFTLADPIQIALATTSVIDVTPHPYGNVLLQPATLTSVPVGAAVQNGTATGYAWVQTRGLANVLSDGAITVGRPVTPSTSVAGALMAQATGTQPIVGYAAITTTDQKYAPFFLILD